MTLASTLAVTLFGMTLALAAWWMWARWREAGQRAELYERLATLGRAMHGITHDLAHVLDNLHKEVQRARQDDSRGTDEVLRLVDEAVTTARGVVSRLGDVPRSDPTELRSAEGEVRVAVLYMRGTGVPIELAVKGDLRYRGTHLDAMLVVQNLLRNAVREALKHKDGRVRVELAEGVLRVTNPLCDGASLDSSIYEPGVSGSGSTGKGLAIAREAGLRIGWRIRHEVRESEVAFLVEPTSVVS